MIVKITSHTLFWENNTHMYSFSLKKKKGTKVFCKHQLVKALIVCSEKRAILSPEPINNQQNQRASAKMPASFTDHLDYLSRVRREEQLFSNKVFFSTRWSPFFPSTISIIQSLFLNLDNFILVLTDHKKSCRTQGNHLNYMAC